MVCLVGRGPEDVADQIEFPTDTPERFLERAIGFFERSADIHGPLEALGLASFGPVELNRESPRYGHVMRTPKPGWSDVDVVSPLRDALGVPVSFDTDVNGAGIGEYTWGAGRGLPNFVYVTVGTGIGAGIILHGTPLRGLSHPEVGHIRPPRAAEDEDFAGVCPFHGDCLEGLASGAALSARWGARLEDLGPDHPSLELEAGYLAHLCTELTYMISPHRIVIGGGVGGAPGLIEAVRRRAAAELGGYLAASVYASDLADYIVRPALAAQAGALGALAMAMRLAAGPQNEGAEER